MNFFTGDVDDEQSDVLENSDDDEEEPVPEDNEDEDDEIDEDLTLSAPVKGKKRKSTKKSSSEKKSKKVKKQRNSVRRFFAEQAEIADDSESDVEESGERNAEVVQNKDVIEAVQRVERRHEVNRERLNKSAEDLAREYEERAREQVRHQQTYGRDDDVSMGGRVVSTSKQSLLPSISDPGIWRVKCRPKEELVLVRAIMLKAFDHKAKTGVLTIKSAFTTSTTGMIYIEAMAEPFAKEAISGLFGFYISTFARIPVEEMTSLFNVTFKKKPLSVGQFVRIKRGMLKGDLAQVVELFDSGMKAVIKAVPRPDYNGSYGIKTVAGNAVPTNKSKLRPSQKLFDAEEVRAVTGQLPERSRFHLDREMYDVFNNEHFKDGFLFKEVNVATFLQSVDINPKLEELQMFLSKTKLIKDDDNDNEHDNLPSRNIDDEEELDDDNKDDEDNGIMSSKPTKTSKKITSIDENENPGSNEEKSAANNNSSNNNTNLLQEIAKQLHELGGLDSISGFEDTKRTALPYVVGDLVQVTDGELKNLIGKVIGVNDITKIIRILPKNNNFHSEIDIEAHILMKYITPGSHVKVVIGKYTGLTGRVVSVNLIDGDYIAAILTDGTNSEIQCNTEHLQISEEVTSGLSSLLGYELYDLVVVNENETAVVINVGAEKLRVINHMDVIKEILTHELQGKRNTQSQRSTAFDAQQNTIHIGDSVKVNSGINANRTGTIKHIMKGNIWLHSNAYLKTSGIFVIKGRSCVLCGNLNKKANAGLSDLIIKPTVSTAKPPVGKTAHGHGGAGGRGKDPNIGKPVRIIKGGFKGLLGQIVDVTETHYTLELLARMKKIVIEKTQCVMADENSSSSSFNRMHTDMGGSTPFMGSETPRNIMMGNETPRGNYGNETPSYGNGSDTPSRTPNVHGDNFFLPNEMDNSSTPAHETLSWGNPNVNSWGNTLYQANVQQAPDFTPTSLGYSPSLASSPSSGFSPMSHTSNDSSNWSEWIENIVVIFKRGAYLGRQGVIVRIPDYVSQLFIFV